MKSKNCSFDKYPTPIFGGESTGTVFDAYVWEQNGRLRMDFSWRPRKALGVTFSDDGIHWEEPVVTLDLSEANTWENAVQEWEIVDCEEDEDLSVTFKIARDGSVTVIRRGDHSSRMRFNAEKNTSMRYHIPQGNMLIDIDTKHVEIEYQNQPFSGKVNISYDLYSGQQLIGNYDLQLYFTV